MVDSSIGGKTGINNEYGKNQVGNFYDPLKIYIDINFIKTLPQIEVKNGMAEVIKTALVGSKKLWDVISKLSLIDLKNKEVLKNIIKICALTKHKIVQCDKEDKKLIRECLNFGHTIGHAYESITGLKHGYCVAIGMCKEMLLKKDNKIITPLLLRHQIINILKNYNLPTDFYELNDEEEMIKKIKHDKKKNRIVTIEKIGKPVIIKSTRKDIIEILSNKLYLNNNNEIYSEDFIVYKVPPSKSETNRVLLIAALSKSNHIINNVLIAEDTIIMLNALQNLGIKYEIIKENKASIDIKIFGCNGEFPNKKCSLYFGNSGTTTRFLIPILTMQKGNIEYTINCDDRMKKRPMKKLFNLMQKIVGNSIFYKENQYELPIIIKSGNFNKNIVDIKLENIESSQIVTGLLISLLTVPNRDLYKINIGSNPVSINFINLTIHILSKFGIILNNNLINNNYIIKFSNNDIINNQKIININSDITSASYPIIYALINKINLFIPNININCYQGDIKYCYNLLKKIGYFIEENNRGIMVFGNNKSKLNEIGTIDFDSSDTFLTFCILAAFTPGRTEIKNISNQEKKECNRITVICEILEKCGIQVKKNNDGLVIYGLNNLEALNRNEIVIDTHNDHRIAMCCSLLSSKMENIVIKDYHCVNKTYPTFWEDIKQLKLSYELENIKNKKYFENYNDNLLEDAIILTGMPCSGKTTLGKNLSKFLNYKFIDLDLELKNYLDVINLVDFIKEFGFKKFREAEYYILKFILENNKEKIVLSCGGGIIEYYKSCELLSNYKYVIFMNRNFNNLEEDFIKRGNNPYEICFKFLYKIRYKKYLSNCYFKFNILEDEELNETKTFFNKWIYNLLFKKLIDYKSYFLCLGDIDYKNNVETVKKEIENCDAVEMRADLYKNYNIKFLENQLNILQRISNKPIIFTFRKEGKYEIKKKINVKKILNMAIMNGCSYIDLELGNDVLLNKKKSFIIGSVHASHLCIIRENLLNIKKKKTDVLKVVGKSYFYNHMENLIYQFDIPKIILCDDYKGNILRLYNQVLSPVCAINYPPMNKSQFNINELITCQNIINKDGNKKYYLFGTDIQKSPSPFIHNFVFDDNMKYENYESDNINKIIDVLNKKETYGASVTMPYKEKIIKYLDYISFDAYYIQAVNTVVKKSNGKLYGFNTDFLGISDILKLHKDITSKGLVIGTGGTSLSACYALKSLDIYYDIMGRNKNKMIDIKNKFNGSEILNINEDNINDLYNLIIICVPPGVYIDLSNIDKNCVIIDLRYGLSKEEKDYFKKFKNYYCGFEVLWRQAYYQYKLWSNKEINYKLYDNAMKNYFDL